MPSMPKTAPDLRKPGDFAAAVLAAKDYAAKNYGTTAAEWAGCVNPEPLISVPRNGN